MSEILSQKDIQKLEKLNLIQATTEAQVERINLEYNEKYLKIINDSELTKEQQIAALKKLKNTLVKERTQSELSKALKAVKDVLSSSTKELNFLTKEYEAAIKTMESIILKPVVEYEEELKKAQNVINEAKAKIDSYIDALRYAEPNLEELNDMEAFVQALPEDVISQLTKETQTFGILFKGRKTMVSLLQEDKKEEVINNALDLLSDTTAPTENHAEVIDVLKPLKDGLTSKQKELYERFALEVQENSLSDHSINTTMVAKIFINLIKELDL